MLSELVLKLDGPQINYVRSVLTMAKIGKNFDFHGSFTDKEEAKKKETSTPGAFIRERIVHGKKRFFVLSEKNK